MSFGPAKSNFQNMKMLSLLRTQPCIYFHFSSSYHISQVQEEESESQGHDVHPQLLSIDK